MPKMLLLLALILPLAGCFSPQELVLSPNIAVSASKEGGGKPVRVEIADRRAGENGVIGYQGKEGKTDAPVAVGKAALENALAQKIESALKAKGFAVDAGAPRALRVDVSELRYRTRYKIWNIMTEVDASLSARTGQEKRSYRNAYTAHAYDRSKIAATEEKNRTLVNAAIDEAVTRMMADKTLIATLAGK